jgi:hypothetical protein
MTIEKYFFIMTASIPEQPSFRGSCLCGDIQYSIVKLPFYAVYCHCRGCRKFSGSPFSALIGVSAAELILSKGNGPNVGRFKKTPTTHLRFCNSCGSSLYVEKTGDGLIHIRMGTLDFAPHIEINAHIHTNSKADWYTLPKDGIPRYPADPPSDLVSELIRTRLSGL